MQTCCSKLLQKSSQMNWESLRILNNYSFTEHYIKCNVLEFRQHTSKISPDHAEVATVTENFI